MFELIGIAVVIWLIWKFIKLIAKTATTQSYHEGAASALSLPDAQAQYDQAKSAFIEAFYSPGTPESDNIQSILDKAVFLQSRIEQLSGRDSGSSFRARHRAELIAEANRFGTEMASLFEQHVQAKDAKIGGSPEESAHDYETFEEWLSEFKDAAAAADSDLATVDGICLIDLMDLTPLRRAFDQGVDPGELGDEFGDQFDMVEFLRTNHQQPN